MSHKVQSRPLYQPEPTLDQQFMPKGPAALKPYQEQGVSAQDLPKSRGRNASFMEFDYFCQVLPVALFGTST